MWDSRAADRSRSGLIQTLLAETLRCGASSPNVCITMSRPFLSRATQAIQAKFGSQATPIRSVAP